MFNLKRFICPKNSYNKQLVTRAPAKQIILKPIFIPVTHKPIPLEVLLFLECDNSSILWNLIKNAPDKRIIRDR